MAELEGSIFIDTVSEEEAIKKAAAAMGVPVEKVIVKAKKPLPSGMFRFEMTSESSFVTSSLAELLERVDFQISQVETRQVLNGYSAGDLGNVGGGSFNELEDSSKQLIKRCGPFEIPISIDVMSCDEVSLQDFDWLQLVQKHKPCKRGDLVAIWAGDTKSSTVNAIGASYFVPPTSEDASGIESKTENQQIRFYAQCGGRLVVCKETLYLVPIDIPGQIGSFDVSNPMKATCIFLPPIGNGRPLNMEAIQTFLAYSKVKFGIQDNAIAEALMNCNSKLNAVSVCVAKGLEQMNGKDAVLEAKFEKHLSAEEYRVQPDGHIDYHRKVIIPTAKKDDLLAVVTLPTSGQPGIDVFGNMLMPNSGSPMPMAAGEGVYTSSDGREFYAERLGQVNYGPDSISVYPVYTVDGDVDAHSGNVEFDGNVFVKGTVQTGFFVKAKGNIEVKGDVDSAIIEAGRDLTVHGGIVGGHNSIVKVGHNLVARHLYNATVEVEGDVHVRNSCLNSTVETTGSFFCIDGQGVTIGGTIFTMKGGRIKELGNDANAKTLVVCGQDFLIQKKIHEAKRTHSLIEEDKKKLDAYIAPILQRMKQQQVRLSEEQQKKILAMIALRKKLNVNSNVMTARIKRLTESVVIPDNVELHIYKKMFPGSVVQICGGYYHPKQDEGPTVLAKDPKTGVVFSRHAKS